MLRKSTPVRLIFLVGTVAPAKDKNKATLPADVINAHTVLVVVKPDAGEPLTNPMTNQTAEENVEKALMKWGRFELAVETRTANVIIAIRKGNGRSINPTIAGGPIDQRPVILEPTDGGVRVGGQRRPGDLSTGADPNSTPHVQTEIGPSEDLFEVYRGGMREPLDAAPAWRYMAKDALNTPKVPAVEQFRKAIDDATKAASNNKQQP
jgi:hypothetical protein